MGNGDRQLQTSYNNRMQERVERAGHVLDSNNETLMRVIEEGKDWRDEYSKELKGLHDRVSVMSMLHEAQKEAIRLQIADEDAEIKSMEILEAQEQGAKVALNKWQQSLAQQMRLVSNGDAEVAVANEEDVHIPFMHGQLHTLEEEEDEECEQIDYMSTSYKLSTRR